MNKRVIDHVSKLFGDRFPHYNDNIKKDERLKIIYDEVCKSPNIKIYSSFEIIDGMADKKIIELIENYFRNERQELWASCENLRNNVKGVISNIELFECSKDAYEYIVNKVVARLVKYYNYRELNAGGFIDKIETLYFEEKGSLVTRLRNNISRVVNKYGESFDLTGGMVNQKALEEYIFNIVIMNTDYDIIAKIDTGKYDGDILKLANTYIKNNSLSKPDSFSHIAKIIQANTQEQLSEYELEYYVKKIEQTLRARGYHGKEIVLPETTQEIMELFTYFKQRRQSIEEKKQKEREEKRNRKIKHETRKRRMFIGTVSLAVAGTLVAAGFGVKKVVEVIDDGITDLGYRNASSEMGGDEYKTVFTKHSKEFKDNAELIVENYNKYSKLGENYGYLSFYDAYRHISGEHRLAIMDAMLAELKVNHNLDVGTTYYIDFMYDRLVELGCEDVQKSKYTDVVEKYKTTARNNKDSDKTTWECLDDGDKKLIEDIRDMYKEYSSKCYKQLAEIGVVDFEDSPGRKI